LGGFVYSRPSYLISEVVVDKPSWSKRDFDNAILKAREELAGLRAPDLTPYGYERWEAGKNWQPELRREISGKPFLTAADLVMLREMKVGL